MATLYNVNGSSIEVHPKNGSDFTLEELQYYVGGYIQVVPFPDGTMIVLNEEGKLENLPINPGATEVWIKHYGYADVMVGPALVCTQTEIR